MNTIHCPDVRAWLASEHQAAPRTELLEHIAACGTCQGALLLSALTLGETGSEQIDCDTCQLLLPELIDTADQARALAPPLAGVLLHLCTCTDCLVVYRLTLALKAAERSGALAAPPRLPKERGSAQRHVRLLTLARAFLNLALPGPAASLSLARGADNGPTVIAETPTPQGFLVQIQVAGTPADDWVVTVTLTPPPTGWVELSLGMALFRAPLDTDGTAQLRGIPQLLLFATDGLDLGITLDPA